MLLSQTPDQIPDLNDLLGIKAYRRLIQNNDFGITQYGLCQPHTLPVTF